MAESVTLISQYFYPETAATAQLLTELAVELCQRGMNMVVYTAQPSYHCRKRLPKKEILHGVRIHRLFSTQFGKKRLHGRLLDGITFSIAAFFKLLLSRQRGILLATTNPPFLIWVVLFISILRKRKYVVLIHDVYPDVAIKLGYMSEKGVITRIWRWLNKHSYKRARAIVVLGEEMRRIIQQAGADPSKIHVIHSWADGSLLYPQKKDKNPFVKQHGLEGKIVVLYSGNLGQAHDLESLVEAADQLRDLQELVFLFIGEGAKKEKLVSMVREKGLVNVVFLPPVPYEELRFSLPAGDIGVVTLERGVEGLCEPSKLYAYLAAGLAILALVGRSSEVARIIEMHKCGFRVDQNDVKGVVEVLRRWMVNREEMEEMKHRARKCFEQHYDKRIAIGKYLELLRTL